MEYLSVMECQRKIFIGSISGQNQVKQSCGIAPRQLLYKPFVYPNYLGPLGKLGSTVINVVCVD